MKKMLIAQTTFEVQAGVERALINLLKSLPADRYEIDLLLFDDKGFLFDQIPKHVNMLPFLTQYTRYSPELINWLNSTGNSNMAEVRTKVHERNLNPEFQKLTIFERYNINWEDLKTICPHYEGYDIAIAYNSTLPLRIVAENVTATRKIGWIHSDVSQAKGFDLLSPYFSVMDSIVCLTKQNVDAFSNIFPNLSQRTIAIPHISDYKRIRDMSNQFYPDEYTADSFNVFTSARLSRTKGIHFIVEAARILKSTGVNFHWLIAGYQHKENEYYKDILSALDKYDLTDVVIFAGEKQNPFPYYKYCDLYVQPSLYEGLCIALQEARILNCPILATKFASVTDSITDGQTGMLCDINAESLAGAIELLYNDPSLRNRLADGNNGFTGESSIEKYIELLG